MSTSSSIRSPICNLEKDQSWISLNVPPSQLRLDVTLMNGQAFGWAPLVPPLNYPSSSPFSSSTSSSSAPLDWVGVIESYPLVLRQTADDVLYLPLTHAPLHSTQRERSNSKADNNPALLDSGFATSVVKSENTETGGATSTSSDDSESSLSPSNEYKHDNNALERASRPSSLDSIVRDYFHLPLPLPTSSSSASTSTSSSTSTSLSSSSSSWGQLHGAKYDLDVLFDEWMRDAHFRTVAHGLRGMRLLRQDPLECTISFICSSNNNIARITQMLTKLRARAGVHLGTLEYCMQRSGEAGTDADAGVGPASVKADVGFGRAGGKEDDEKGRGVMGKDKRKKPMADETAGKDGSGYSCSSSSLRSTGVWTYLPPLSSTSSLSSSSSSPSSSTVTRSIPLYSFPVVDALCSVREEDLRAMGYGYRAKYVAAASQTIKNKGGKAWLLGLRSANSAATSEALQELSGVGRKVADCIALFSMDKLDTIPVDVHVYNVALRDYGEKFHAFLNKEKEEAEAKAAAAATAAAAAAAALASQQGPPSSPKKGGKVSSSSLPSTATTSFSPSSIKTLVSASVFKAVAPSSSSSSGTIAKAAKPTLTPALYASIVRFFRSTFPNVAGWAHSVLFTADLAAFRTKARGGLGSGLGSGIGSDLGAGLGAGLGHQGGAIEGTAVVVTSAGDTAVAATVRSEKSVKTGRKKTSAAGDNAVFESEKLQPLSVLAGGKETTRGNDDEDADRNDEGETTEEDVEVAKKASRNMQRSTKKLRKL